MRYKISAAKPSKVMCSSDREAPGLDSLLAKSQTGVFLWYWWNTHRLLNLVYTWWQLKIIETPNPKGL